MLIFLKCEYTLTTQASQSSDPTRAHLRISKVDLHDECDGDPCGKGKAGSDDDGEAVPLTGTAIAQGVVVGLPQRREVLAGQIRGRGGESLQTSRPQEQVRVCRNREC